MEKLRIRDVSIIWALFGRGRQEGQAAGFGGGWVGGSF